MSHHMELKRTRSSAATRLAAAWRGYCVRLNTWALSQAVIKIQKWWQDIKTFEMCSEAIIEVLVEARQLREGYTAEKAVKIQRAVRNKLLSPVSSIKQMKAAAVKM